VIVVSNLSKSYGGRLILKDVSLSVARQEVLAVIGPSGSGKTTLIRILDLLVRPTSGAILRRYRHLGVRDNQTQAPPQNGNGIPETYCVQW
jgi:ABC-type multidrug transport system ATPase subunit